VVDTWKVLSGGMDKKRVWRIFGWFAFERNRQSTRIKRSWTTIAGKVSHLAPMEDGEGKWEGGIPVEENSGKNLV
jgi:hypothetical protein